MKDEISRVLVPIGIPPDTAAAPDKMVSYNWLNVVVLYPHSAKSNNVRTPQKELLILPWTNKEEVVLFPIVKAREHCISKRMKVVGTRVETGRITALDKCISKMMKVVRTRVETGKIRASDNCFLFISGHVVSSICFTTAHVWLFEMLFHQFY